MKEKPIFNELQKTFREAPPIAITDTDRIVIFSDLHLGNGGRRDDFLGNSELFKTALRDYYLENNYTLILNGDIEELQRFPLKSIKTRWHEIYDLFHQFKQNNAFYKILGNHDHELNAKGDDGRPNLFLNAIKLTYHGNPIFIFHGHQASYFMEKFNSLCGFVLRYIANPIGIKNFSYSYDSQIRFRTERRVYNFSRQNKIVSFIGHTHRPLFESLSKTDWLKFKIEQLCREYPTVSSTEQNKLATKIATYNRELIEHLNRNKTPDSESCLYNSDLLVPCIFNSGSVINKNGITSLEISGGNIALVHWFDQTKSNKYFNYNGFQPLQLGDSDFFRVVLKEDDLAYIFTRIQLLA